MKIDPTVSWDMRVEKEIYDGKGCQGTKGGKNLGGKCKLRQNSFGSSCPHHALPDLPCSRKLQIQEHKNCWGEGD